MSAKEETRKTKANEKKLEIERRRRIETRIFTFISNQNCSCFPRGILVEREERTESLNSRLAGLLNYNDREKKVLRFAGCRLFSEI